MALRVSDCVEKKLKTLKGQQRDRSNGVSLAFASQGAKLRSELIAIREADEAGPVVVAESFASVKEMSASDRVRKRDVSKAPVVIFRHAEDGGARIVYRRPDGNTGSIDIRTPIQNLNLLAAKTINSRKRAPLPVRPGSEHSAP